MSEAEFLEIKTLKWLREMYCSRGPDAMADSEQKMLNDLNDRWQYVDCVQMLIDEVDRLKLEIAAMRAVK